ncbi:unnamed protein product [Amaranthus hypochondriacus]
MIVDYKEYAQKVFTISHPRAPSFDAWHPPASGWIKVNFDAYVGAGCKRGLGIVCCDECGNVLVTGTRLCKANWNVETSEAMAAKYGLEVCKRMGFMKIHVEGDALNVISAIIRREAGRAPIYLIYESLFSLIDTFDDVHVSFVRRGGNTVAHMVARWETDFAREKVCMPPFPDCLRSLAALDLS